MKKIFLVLLFTSLIILLTGCGKVEELTAETVNNNTILIREDGSLQVALVSLFDKDYYEVEEFKDYASEEISKYNSTEGANSITVDVIDKNNDKVTTILTYSNMDHYSKFNDIEGKMSLVADLKSDEKELPDSFLDKKGNEVSLSDSLKKDDYKVFTINEHTNVVVEGKILYYYNGNYIDSKTIETDDEEMTFIIYRDPIF